MGKHLIRKGKRRCYGCKKILPLSADYFVLCKKEAGGLSYRCKSCERVFWRTYPKKHSWRIKIITAKNFQCEKCGIKNSNTSFFDIDHKISKKVLGISRKQKMFYSKELFNAQVLCPNCHRIKTILNQEFR
jgi:5-methylcytosine-specific restriction endonuclease McrA